MDLVICSDENMVIDVKVLEHVGNSEHNIIVWNLVCDVDMSRNEEPSRQYHKADYVAMKESFKNINWLSEFKDLDVDDKLNEHVLHELSVKECCASTTTGKDGNF